MAKNIFIINFIVAFCWAQVSVPSIPKSFEQDNLSNFQKVVLPSFDISRLLDEDRLENESEITKPYRFANPISVKYNMNTAGTWTNLPDGSLIWRLEIESTGALFLKDLISEVVFTQNFNYDA